MMKKPGRSQAEGTRWWTLERIAKLREFFEQDEPTSKIAAYFGDGCTKSAVIGKLHRLKMVRRTNHQVRLNAAMARTQRRAERKTVKRFAPRSPAKEAQMPNLPPTDASPMPRADAWQPLPGSTPVILEQRTGCAWPCYDDAEPHLFCNEPTEAGRSFCTIHHRRAYTGIPKRSPAPVRVSRAADRHFTGSL